MRETRNGHIFLAGASGAVGRRLCRLLVADGWAVTGTTRSAEKTGPLREMGVEPVVVDVFDERALWDAVVASRPEFVVHQLTDLPPGLDPARMDEGRVRTARLREVGTRNLIDAAVAAGARRLIAQSIAFAYPPSVESLETQVLHAPPPMREGIVLRYGQFYGPGTGVDAPPSVGPVVHVDAAADAARRAITRGSTGIYKIAEDDDGDPDSNRRARDELGWDPAFRISNP